MNGNLTLREWVVVAICTYGYFLMLLGVSRAVNYPASRRYSRQKGEIAPDSGKSLRFRHPTNPTVPRLGIRGNSPGGAS